MTKQLYILMNRATGMVAARDCEGEHDGRFSDDVGDAREFKSFGEASDFSQNFSDDWQPEAIFDETPMHATAILPAGHHRSYRYDY